MNLDSLTLLFSLILTDVLMVIALLVAVYGQAGRREGMDKWVAAIFLESLVWIVASARGAFPDLIIVAMSLSLKAASHAMMLSAICEFQGRRAPRWQYIVPIVAALVMVFMTLDSIRARYFWSSLLFIAQLFFIARALLFDREARGGRAWQIMFAGVAVMILVLVLRAYAALAGHSAFAQVTNDIAPQPVQILAFITIMAMTLLGSIGFILMVKERADRKIMRLAMTDSLTQIPNRRALMESAEQVLARRTGAPVTMMMIDVDYFKRINDDYGHPAGDDVLFNVARRLTGRLRGSDLLGRYGGEEFCVIAPDTGMEGAMQLAESLREVIALTPFETEKGSLDVRISIGIALCPVNGMRALKEMLAEADSALYTAKKTGRNKVVCFSVAHQDEIHDSNTLLPAHGRVL